MVSIWFCWEGHPALQNYVKVEIEALTTIQAQYGRQTISLPLLDSEDVQYICYIFISPEKYQMFPKQEIDRWWLAL